MEPKPRSLVVRERSLAVRQTRLAVQRALASERTPGIAIVALSGGADSLALAAAAAYEGPRAGWRIGALVVDHGLQEGSADVAARAAEDARGLGLDPVHIERVRVAGRTGAGPEAAARSARYRALREAAELAAEHGRPVRVFTAHTRDDQAEQVLLALARGSGSRSVAGIPPRRPFGAAVLIRPFLGADPEVYRATTEEACRVLGLEYWEDPHNRDPQYARVRVRERLLPALADELGPGVVAGLARSADLARADADALDALAAEWVESFRMPHPGVQEVRKPEGRAEVPVPGDDPDDPDDPDDLGDLDDPDDLDDPEVQERREAGEIRMPIERLAALPSALRTRVIRETAAALGSRALSLEHTRAIEAFVSDWRGQGPAHVPGLRIAREGTALVFRMQRE